MFECLIIHISITQLIKIMILMDVDQLHHILYEWKNQCDIKPNRYFYVGLVQFK